MKLRRVNILRHGMWDDGRIGNSAPDGPDAHREFCGKKSSKMALEISFNVYMYLKSGFLSPF